MRDRSIDEADRRDEGFTLIELLVVMIIIGILAAIAIPVFLSQRAKATDTATKADVSVLGKEIATYHVDGTGTLTASQAVTNLPSAGGKAGGAITITNGSYTSAALKVSKGSTLGTGTAGFSSSSSTSWCISLSNAAGTSTSNTWKYSASSGLVAGACP